jgi:FKBP-type peptidyl-prolyl cis-trans isomerase SlyD
MLGSAWQDFYSHPETTMKIENNCVVSIHYTLKNDGGQVLDSSEGREPLVYLHGANNIIRGLEDALDGKSSGDSFSVSVLPEDGYGVRNEEMVQKATRETFSGFDKLEPGMVFSIETDNGLTQQIVITEIEGDIVTVDANHPLAGQTLHFTVSVENIRQADPQEIQHGHAH